MVNIQHIPARELSDYIAAYWVRKSEPAEEYSGRRVYADGCADLIFNAGDSTVYFNPKARAEEVIPLYPRQLYLGGTMTAYGVVFSKPGSALTGIRFRPGGFYAFYAMTMEPVVDGVIEFHDDHLKGLMEKEEGLPDRLNTWFSRQSLARNKDHDFSVITRTVYRSGGQVSVDLLARQAHVSNRTLERRFKENIGISPKEFLQIVRFQEVLKRLQQAGEGNGSLTLSEESLFRIAVEFGYYDHAHLTNEFKKYSGILPSELSHFYKTGIAGSQYF